jgi:hypothetical protein
LNAETNRTNVVRGSIACNHAAIVTHDYCMEDEKVLTF